jgi:hypothetical protein
MRSPQLNTQCVRRNYTSAATNAVVVEGVANRRIIVTRFSASNDNGGANAVAYVAGFHPTVTPTGAAVVSSHAGLGAGSFHHEGAGSGIVGKSAAGESLLITAGNPGAGNGFDVCVSYYFEEDIG